MSGKASIIIPIIEMIIKNDDINDPSKQIKKWKIGYSHERVIPTSDRLFVWKINHIEDAKIIVESLIKSGVTPHIYEGGKAEAIEWVFLYYDKTILE